MVRCQRWCGTRVGWTVATRAGFIFVVRSITRRSPSGAPERMTLAYFATGIVNSAPLAMLSGQRCITLLKRV
ncbi:hypothetical protein PTE31013_00013 [Pandoraea terrigena]|uniref:Uncharacterized protein n=1 Tax=Pandoraea terrigena TaxID=2508292 RepID=A0A5E4RAW3_9BURK|nr:hypothetical protein PTE31013_00013 [Pandoraea terrigena]